MAANETNIIANTPIAINDAIAAYMPRKVVLLPLVYRSTIFEKDLVNGGGAGKFQFIEYQPPVRKTPTSYTLSSGPSSVQTTPLDLVPISPNPEINIGLYDSIVYTEWENRVARGGFDFAFTQLVAPIIDGFVVRIEQEIASQYANVTTAIGGANTTLTDALFRSGLKRLADLDIYPERGNCNFVMGTDAFWIDILGEDEFARQDNAGDIATLTKVKLAALEKYNVPLDYTPSIVNSSGSNSSATTHNLLGNFQAIGISFLKWIPIADLVSSVGQNVEEDTLTTNNIVLRTRKWYDPKDVKVYLTIDIAFGTYMRQPAWLIDVQS